MPVTDMVANMVAGAATPTANVGAAVAGLLNPITDPVKAALESPAVANGIAAEMFEDEEHMNSIGGDDVHGGRAGDEEETTITAPGKNPRIPKLIQPYVTDPQTHGLDAALLTQLASLHDKIVGGLQTAGVMEAGDSSVGSAPASKECVVKDVAYRDVPQGAETDGSSDQPLTTKATAQPTTSTTTTDTTHVQPMSPTTTTTTTQNIHIMAANLERQHEIMAKPHRINAAEAEQTQKMITKTNDEVQALRKMVTKLQTQINAMTTVRTFDVSTPLPKTLKFTPDDPQESGSGKFTTRLSIAATATAAAIAATQQPTKTNDDCNDRDDQLSKTTYLMQYRATGITYNGLSDGKRKAVRIAMRDLISLTNGLDESDVDIGYHRAAW